MKFSIKFKIIALGAVLSILVTSVAVVFANFEYRRRAEDNMMVGIDGWLANINNDFTDPGYGDEYINTLKKVETYILEQYEKFPTDAPEGASVEDQKNFYKDRFRWLYAIEGLGMYPMSSEEIEFRKEFEEFAFLLSDAKSATKSSAVYMAFITEDKTLFYIGDEYAYRKVTRPDMLFPGSRVYNFDAPIVPNGNYYDSFFKGKKSRVLPIMENNVTLAYIFVEYDFTDIDKDVNSLIKMEIIVLSIASVFMILFYTIGAHFLFLKNISKLHRITSEFNDDLRQGKEPQIKDPKINSQDEVYELSKSFVALEEGIVQYTSIIQQEAKEKERTNAELLVATNIQLGALPDRKYDDSNASIRAFIKSAKEVGGDFYDYFYLDDNRLAIIISDVSGKGIPAALFMMKSKELIRSAVRNHDDLVSVARDVNNALARNNKELLFVTSFIGIIDFNKNEITYVNAGHEKPYVVSSKGVRKLDGESNFVMGGEEGFEYKQEKAPFDKDEYIFLFTDGLNESINHSNEEFSYERIEKTLEENRDSSPDKVIESMNRALEDFVDKEEQFDDVTMVVIKHQNNELHLSYDKKDYSIITEIVDSFNAHYPFVSEECKSKCGIIIDEMVNNLISYEKREDLVIDLDFKLENENMVLTIKDNGEDYNPFDNHKEKYLEGFHPEIEEGGFGLMIIKDLSKSYKYEYKNHHAIITIVLSAK